MSPDTLAIDGVPLPVARPASVAELSALVREGRPLYPVGGGTMLHIGLPPARPGVAVDMTAMDALIDHAARDMTVTVQAGMRISRLQALLATEGQRLPIDIPRPDEATLGGSIAANVSGPRRFGAGTFRDYVIGISTVGEAGHETKAGGRVVKNVAGYDLCKLHTGALGTLGIITQVTLKVRPVPETQALVSFGCEEGRLAGLLDALHGTQTRPICVEASRSDRWTLTVGFEDSEAAVESQLQQIIRELASVGVHHADVAAGSATETLWQALVEKQTGAGEVTFKANMPPSRLAVFCHGVPREWPLHVHAGSGIVWGHSPPGLTEAVIGPMLEGCAIQAAMAGGNLTVPRCPAPWKAGLPVWGRRGGEMALMLAVKKKLDTKGVFNPGRFLDGA